MSEKSTSYSEYLQLDSLLTSQKPLSDATDQPVHDEMFFIIIHQVYELWFKQVLLELDSIITVFAEPLQPKHELLILSRLQRVNQIFNLLVEHIPVLETLSPMEFLKFRSLLVPASGFQSLQFRQLEMKLGVYANRDISQQAFYSALSSEQQQVLIKQQTQPHLFHCLENWLAQPSAKVHSFLQAYKQAMAGLQHKGGDLEVQQELLQLLDEDHYKVLQQKGEKDLSYAAFSHAMYIFTHYDLADTHVPYGIIQAVIELDELIASWRERHALMVQRMIGNKKGTGGSQGFKYLQSTIERNRVFADFANLSGYLIAGQTF